LMIITDGDLQINGVSTRQYKDRDWDTYRNHSIGFVFQSYNLIPHQTILENVELSLTIGGVGKEERRQRAKKVLDEVGLKGQYNKKPNQLSGGQCQRVAIARALVNDPDILLADEPTGALDSVTSEQIMELIKQISKDRLVIMVTHNAELAERFSTRIIKLFDGEVIADSNPYDYEESLAVINKEKARELERIEEERKQVEAKGKKFKRKKDKKSKLSLWQAFKLSARNLRSKIKRTLMVCFAGSIGIIGVASVLAVSNGISGYISKMQDDMLSGNPITITETAFNMDAIMSMMTTEQKKELFEHSVKEGYVNVQSLVDSMLNTENGVASFQVQNNITQDYIDFVKQMPDEYINEIALNYGVDITNNVYTDIKLEGAGNSEQVKNMSISSIIKLYTSILNDAGYSQYSTQITSLVTPLAQSFDNTDFILSQYDIISDAKTSKMATEANEIMIVVGEDDKLTDLLLTELGYYSQKEFFTLVDRATGNDYNEEDYKNQFSYDELLGKTFTYYPNNDIYTATGVADSPFTYASESDAGWGSGVGLKVTAILKPKADLSYGCLSSGVYYTPALTRQFLQDNLTSDIVKYLQDNDLGGYNIVSASSPIPQNKVVSSVTYYYDGTERTTPTFVGTASLMVGMMGGPMLSLNNLGGSSLPTAISIYPKDFTFKDKVTDYLDKWNEEGDIVVGDKTLTKAEREEIIYSDYLSLVIAMVGTLVDVITYALVAFTSLSLIVSTVMIAIITYVSVIERVKEIGVIRSLGGRKRDVSNLFIAETVIIGGFSGLFGVLITYGLCGIINLIVGSLAGIYTIASLHIVTAIIMIVISILLTLISGIIPAKIAAKKDPVDALRSE